MSLTNVGEQVVLNRVFIGGVSQTGTVNAQLDGTGVYMMSLHTGDPGEAGAMTNECTGTNYAAKQLDFSVGGNLLSEATGTDVNQVDLNTTVEFTDNANTTAAWGTISHYGIHVVNATTDTLSATNMLFKGQFDANAVVNSGDTVQIVAGTSGLVITVA